LPVDPSQWAVAVGVECDDSRHIRATPIVGSRCGGKRPDPSQHRTQHQGRADSGNRNLDHDCYLLCGALSVAPSSEARSDPQRPVLEARGRVVGKALEAGFPLYPCVEDRRTVTPMEFRILGPLEVADGDGPRSLGGPRQRTVLAHLVLRANQNVTSDRLIAEVWGDEPPPAVRSTLRGYVSHLRKAVGPGLVEHSSGGYVLRAERSAIDAVRFEALVAEARAVMSVDPAAAARAFEQALGLWRGPALADLADQASLQPEIARLEELRLAALEDRITAELELGRHRELVPELETLVGAHPFRERLWLHLMTALYRSDRQADALAAFHRARDLLAEELGIDPSPELRRLQERILRQDPSLNVAGEPLRGYRLLD
jgi:DNA-binding SARP family transcriptional activator